MAPDLPHGQRVTASNWTLPPYNRWSFQRVQQLTRTSRIARAPTPKGLPRAQRDILAFTYRRADGATSTLGAMLERTWTDGFMAIHAGNVICEAYRNGMQPDTLHLLMSCSKSMTSTLAGIAVEAGHLDLAAPVTVYLPELAATALRGATVAHLLDMQVGLRWDEDYADLEGHWRDLEVASGWRPPYPGYQLPLDQLSYMQTLHEARGSHGEAFHYQSVLTDVLGLCVERALDEPFSECFGRLVWQPMGAAHDLVTIIDAGGYPAFEGGFNCTLADFGRFAWLIANDGRAADGTRVVPHRWIEACRFAGPDLIDAFGKSDYAAAMPGYAYHNCWWVRDPERGVIMALGIHGQTAYIDPARAFAAVKFSTQPEHVDMAMALDQMAAFDALASALANA